MDPKPGAPQIEIFVQEKYNVERGSRIGMIRFGSQVSLFPPKATVGELRLKDGSYIYVGRTSICMLRHNLANCVLELCYVKYVSLQIPVILGITFMLGDIHE
jgi:hypothetical protein